MRERKDNGSGSLGAALGLAGGFSYLLMLMFMPVGLTAAASGDPLALDPYYQTVVTALVMAVAVVAFALGSGRLQSATVSCCYGVTSGLVALAGALLALLVYLPITPVVVAVLYGVAAGCQMSAAAQRCACLEGPRAGVAVAVGLLVAAVVVLVASLFAPAFLGTALVGAALCVSAAVLVVDARNGGACGSRTCAADGEDRCSARTFGPVRLLAGACAELRFDWQPLVGGCVCALSFGLGWMHVVVGYAPLEEGFSVAGRLCGAVILLGVALRVRRRPGAADPFSPLLFGAAAASVAAWMFDASEPARMVALAVSSLSQLLFMGLVWVETLSTARDFVLPPLLPCLATAVFLAVFSAGALVGGTLPASVAGTVVSALYLGYACLLYASALRNSQEARGHANGPDAPVFDEVCTALAGAYALSPRESEVLPLLVMGLSSPAIGSRLFISAQTVKSHTHRIYGKMGIHSHDELSALFTERSKEMGLAL